MYKFIICAMMYEISRRYRAIGANVHASVSFAEVEVISNHVSRSFGRAA